MSIIEDCRRLYEAGEFLSALKVAQAGLDVSPDDVTLLTLAGCSAADAGDLATAEQYLAAAIARDPARSEFHDNLALVHFRAGQMESAEQRFRHSLTLSPDSVNARVNLSSVLLATTQFDEAQEILEAVRASGASHPDLYANLGFLYHRLGRYRESVDALQMALKLNPQHRSAQQNLALSLLSLGDFDNGWRVYEGRRLNPQGQLRFRLPSTTAPEWRGEELTGKSILLWPEQGFGDLIQFARYAPLVRELGPSRITLVTRAPLVRLFDSVAGVDYVVDRDHWSEEEHGSVDFWTFVGSLPLRMGTRPDSIPTAIPYLSASPVLRAQWQARIPAAPLRIGLAWRGNPANGNDTYRSVPLQLLDPLFAHSEVHWISLQKEHVDEDLAWAGERLTRLDPWIEDFADTAAAVAELDLVICVDTAIAHLVAAMGKPCWVLLSRFGCDWRYAGGGQICPWYPSSMRLYRQRHHDDWSDVVAAVAGDLARLLAERRPAAPAG